MDYIQIGLLIAGLISSVGTILAVLTAKKAMRTDHERRKKQSTIDFYSNISNDYGIPLRNLITEKYKRNVSVIKSTDKEYADNKQEFDNQVRLYVRNMHKIAVGIELDIFDFEVFYLLSGDATIQLYQKIKNLIEERQNDGGLKSFSREFEKLYNKLNVKNRKELLVKYGSM